MRKLRVARGVGGAAIVGVAVVLAYALWWRMNPSACPYGLGFFIELPHPIITRERLRDVLAPRPGDRVLEVGPGTGYYSLHVAEWLEPGGKLDVLDIKQEMLDHVMRRAQERGIENIVPSRVDARDLPYPDDSFDAAYLTVVLGEIPDQDAALRELRRALKPGGRLVVGEGFPDFHTVPFGTLRKRAEAAGFEQRVDDLEADRDTLLRDMADIVPEALDGLSGEERRRVYGMLRIEVTPIPEGFRVSGALSETFRSFGPTGRCR